MIGGSGMGEGFMMSSTQCFDSSNPANNYSRTQTAQFGPNGMMEARESLRDGRRGMSARVRSPAPASPCDPRGRSAWGAFTLRS